MLHPHHPVKLFLGVELRRWVAVLLALAVLMMTAPAMAQPGGASHIRASLQAETLTPAPGASSDIAILMTPEQPWHGYWKNGGDAGFGIEVEWQLPAGVRIGEVRFPVPDTLVISGLMNHVYDHPYALVAPLTIAHNIPLGTPITVRGHARWLACTDEICVPEQGELTLNMVVGSGAITTNFDAIRAALPQPLGATAHYQLAGRALRIAIPLPASLAISSPHLFVETARANRPGAAQTFGRTGDMLIIETAAGDDAATLDSIAGLIRIAPGRGLSFEATRGAVPAARVPLAEAMPTDDGFDAALFFASLLGAILGGLILNIMPCVFPILSLKALALARAGGDERAVRAEGFAYTAGAVFTALALGAILLLLRSGGEAVGWAFQLQRPESVLLLIVLIGAITANLAGLFDFASLSFASRAGRGSPTKTAFMTGALAAFIATPCTGPFLGAALGATLTLPASAALPIFGGLGFGLALPFLALALIPALRTRLPRPGPWMERLRRWLSLPMALTALALVWLLGRQVGPTGWLIGALALTASMALGLWAGRMQRQGGHASIGIFAMAVLIIPLSLLLPAPGDHRVKGERAEGVQPWSEAAQARALASGQPVFVYFTADWCVTCKVNERAAIDSDTTAAAFRAAGVTVLVADWTNADPTITAELARHRRNSVPLYLWYPAGASEPEILPQLLTPAMLVDRAQGR